MRMWQNAGHEAKLFLLSPESGDGSRRDIEAEFFSFGAGPGRLGATRRLYAEVAGFQPAVIYLRYDLFVPPPSRLARVAPTVVEFNSNAQAEWLSRSRAAALYERINERL